jgi:hypothetical protein
VAGTAAGFAGALREPDIQPVTLKAKISKKSLVMNVPLGSFQLPDGPGAFVFPRLVHGIGLPHEPTLQAWNRLLAKQDSLGQAVLLLGA